MDAFGVLVGLALGCLISGWVIYMGTRAALRRVANEYLAAVRTGADHVGPPLPRRVQERMTGK